MTARRTGPEFKVGLYVLSLTAVAVFLVIYIGIKKDLFSAKTTYYVISTTGENVERGIPMRLSGFKIGQVSEVDLNNVDYVKIEIKVLERYRKWFTRDSQIILVQGGFIGQTYLKLVPGKEGSPVLDEGAVVDLNRVGGLDEILAEARPVIEDFKLIMDNVQQLTDQMLDKNSPYQRTMGNVETLSGRLASPDGLVAYLTENPEPVRRVQTLLDHTDQAMVEVNRLLAEATGRVEDLAPIQAEIQGLVAEVRAFVKEIQGFSQDLAPAVQDVTAITGEVRKATQDLERLRTKSEYTLRLGMEVLQRIKETWPLSRGQDPGQPVDHPVP